MRQHKSRVETSFIIATIEKHRCRHTVKYEDDIWQDDMSTFGKFNQQTKKESLNLPKGDIRDH